MREYNYALGPDELYHYGIKGMKWGVRKKYSNDKPLSRRQVKKSINKAKKTGRLIDDGQQEVLGVKQKNGDILFVGRKDVNKFGVDIAEKRTKDFIKEQQSNIKKGKSRCQKEEKELVKDLLKNYDKSDPYREEAMSILKEMLES